MHAASAFAPPVIAAPPGQYDAGVEEGVEGDPSGPSRCAVEDPTRAHKEQEEARGTAATGSRERRHSDEERRGEEKMQESASTNQHPHQHQLTEAAQASLGRGVSRSVDSHSRHIILILSLYSSHKYPYPGCLYGSEWDGTMWRRGGLSALTSPASAPTAAPAAGHWQQRAPHTRAGAHTQCAGIY